MWKWSCDHFSVIDTSAATAFWISFGSSRARVELSASTWVTPSLVWEEQALLGMGEFWGQKCQSKGVSNDHMCLQGWGRLLGGYLRGGGNGCNSHREHPMCQTVRCFYLFIYLLWAFHIKQITLFWVIMFQSCKSECWGMWYPMCAPIKVYLLYDIQTPPAADTHSEPCPSPLHSSHSP